jgi:stage II sporulation protein AA (anti-sigma F factor antagonist)
MCAARDRKPGFDSEFTGTVLRIKLRGEIDHHSAAAVRSAMDDMIRSKRPMEVVIDMSAVDFMDSSGLGLIMGRYNTVKALGGTLTVSEPNEGIEKIMKLAGLERIVKIAHSSKRKADADITKRMKNVARPQRPRAITSLADHTESAKNEVGQKEKNHEKRKI